MSDKETKGYRDTLCLPKTGFSMKANLVQREPQLRKKWAKENIYAQIRKARKGAPLYILHDGPPYANGDIHMGHVINKVLKDLVAKVRKKPKNPNFPPISNNLTLNFWKVGLFLPPIRLTVG